LSLLFQCAYDTLTKTSRRGPKESQKAAPASIPDTTQLIGGKRVGFIAWIENTGIAETIRVSAYGYPIMITLHSLGLAIMVGLSVVLSLRVLGLFSGIPYSSLYRLLKYAWVGFIINFISGGLLFAASATTFIVHQVFLTKMAFVIIGAIFVGIMQQMIKTALATGNAEAAAGSNLKLMAWLTIAAWTIAMITGRFIAYLPGDWFTA
ncbi:MAG: hypothetical protein PVH89_02450, partial [Gammaproteobacteria bacterium]